MKTGELKVGIKGGKFVKVPVQTAENPDDMIKLARGNTAALVRCFNRGFRIEAQERSGARERLREVAEAGGDLAAAQPEIATLVHDFDPSIVKPRVGRPSTPKQVTLPKGKKNFSADDFKAMLAQAGIKVEFAVEGEQPNQAQEPAAAGAGA